MKNEEDEGWIEDFYVYLSMIQNDSLIDSYVLWFLQSVIYKQR
jgi:hypothetical protein